MEYNFAILRAICIYYVSIGNYTVVARLQDTLYNFIDKTTHML